jgi:putative membrane protein
LTHLPGIYARGMAMGAADLVPGVSGGTIAFITGIYEELVATLAGIRPSLLGVWRREGTAAFWRAGNFNFLLALFAGLLTSLVLFAGLLSWLLQHYPVPLWAFFSGLIAASIPLVLRPVGWRRPVVGVMLIPGVALAAWISLQPGLGELGNARWIFFASGALAICAMILPGISGSFILVLLGMYAPVLGALDAGDWLRVGVFVAGTICGLLAFVQVLQWLLHRWHDAVLALMAGFMGGALVKVWPWQWAPAKAAAERPVLPSTYEQLTGESALLLPAVAALLVGGLAAWLLSRAEAVHHGADE